MAEDPKKIIDDQNVYIRDTLMSVAEKFASTLRNAVEDAFDSAEASTMAVVGKDLTKTFNRLAKLSDDFAHNQSKINSGLLKEKDLTKQLQTLSEKKDELNRKMIHAQRLGIGFKEEDYRLALESLKVQEEQLKADQTQLNNIEKRLGLTGKLVQGLNKIPFIGKFFNAEEIERKMRVVAAAGGGTFKTLGTAAFEIGKQLGKGLTDPLTLLTFAVAQINKADKQATELAKSLGLSKEQAYGLRQEFVQYSRAVGDNFVNVDRLTKAQAELTEQLGFAVNFSGKTADDFSRLTELVGLTAQEAGNLSKFSSASNQEISSYTGKLLKGALYAQNATKSHFSAKQILQDVSKLSSGILVKFQGNPVALGQAVAQARALGTSLEAMDKSAESLLNFESSIENELKAELLTGRQLNLERARYAALTGDQATLTKEIADQAGTLQDFQSMNVLAQKSLAEAFGLSKDELADMLLKQEALSMYGDKAKELNTQQIKDFEKQKQLNKDLTLEDYLNQQKEQLSIQDKFNNAVLKLQDLFGNLFAGPLGNFVDLLSKSLNIVNKLGTALSFLATPLKVIASLYLGIKTTQLTLNALKAIETGILIQQAATEGGKLSIQNMQYLLGKQSLGVKIAAYAVSLKEIIAEKASNAAKAIGNMLEKKGLLKSIGDTIMKAMSAIFKGPTGFLGPLAIPLALAAGATVGAKGYEFLTGDDVMSEGYGKRILLDKGSITAFNDDDKIIAGTNLGGGAEAVSPNINRDSINRPMQPSFNTSAITDAISALSNTVSGLVNRPQATPQFALHVDGRQIGTAVGSQMETGTAQMMKTSYKVA